MERRRLRAGARLRGFGRGRGTRPPDARTGLRRRAAFAAAAAGIQELKSFQHDAELAFLLLVCLSSQVS